MVDNNNNSQFIIEGASITMPLGFIGEDYPYWIDRIEMYIKSMQYRLWFIIVNDDIPILRPEA